MPVAVCCRTDAGRSWSTHLARRAARVLRALRLGDAELSVALVDDPEMRRLNRTFRGRDRPTDVLAFAGDAPEPAAAGTAARRRGRSGPPRVLGDVVISLDTAARQARALRRARAERLDVLLIHGILHLVGYDHEVSAVEARRMAARARELRAALPSRTARPGARARRAAPGR